MAEKIRVLLVDDHAVVRQGLRTYLELRPEIEIVGEAACGEESLGLCEELAPDVVLMDLVMPGMGGVEALKAIRKSWPRIQVLALTSFSQDESWVPALRAGAAGYLLKTIKPEDLAQAIRAAHRGEPQLHPEIARKLIKRATAEGAPVAGPESLTPREVEVLRLVARGYPNARLAEELSISVKTVKTHVGHLLAKLCLEDRTQLAIYAHERGLADRGRP